MHPKHFSWVVILLLDLSSVKTYPSDTSISGPILSNRTYKKTENQWKAFISYRRSYSKHLAMLTKVLLDRENISTYLDVEDLEAGYWDDQLKGAILEIPNFIIVLSNGTLNRCIGDTNYTDVLHKEIKTAVDSKRNIIPVFDDYTHPNADFSPEIDEVMRFQGVEWNHSLVNATIHRLMRYLIDDIIYPPTKLTFP